MCEAERVREREGYICALYLLELCVNFIAVFEGGRGEEAEGRVFSFLMLCKFILH